MRDITGACHYSLRRVLIVGVSLVYKPSIGVFVADTHRLATTCKTEAGRKEKTGSNLVRPLIRLVHLTSAPHTSLLEPWIPGFVSDTCQYPI